MLDSLSFIATWAATIVGVVASVVALGASFKIVYTAFQLGWRLV